MITIGFTNKLINETTVLSFSTTVPGDVVGEKIILLLNLICSDSVKPLFTNGLQTDRKQEPLEDCSNGP